MKNLKVIHLMILAIISSTELSYPIIFTGPVRRSANRHERSLAYENGFTDGSGALRGEEEFDQQLTDSDELLYDETPNFDSASENIYYPEAEAIVQSIQNDDQNINADEDSDMVSSDNLLAQDIQVDPTMLQESYSDDANAVITQAMSNPFTGVGSGSQEQQTALREAIISRLQGRVETQAIKSDGEDDFDDNNFDDMRNFDSYQNEDDFAAIQAIQGEVEQYDELVKPIEEGKPALVLANASKQKVVSPVVNLVPVEENKLIQEAKAVHVSEDISAKSASVIANIESPIARSQVLEATHVEQVNVKVYPVYDAICSAINHIKSATLDMYNYLSHGKSTLK